MNACLILVNEMTCVSYDQIRIHFYLSIRALKLSTMFFAIDEVPLLSAVLVDGTRIVRVLGYYEVTISFSSIFAPSANSSLGNRNFSDKVIKSDSV